MCSFCYAASIRIRLRLCDVWGCDKYVTPAEASTSSHAVGLIRAESPNAIQVLWARRLQRNAGFCSIVRPAGALAPLAACIRARRAANDRCCARPAGILPTRFHFESVEAAAVLVSLVLKRGIAKSRNARSFRGNNR